MDPEYNNLTINRMPAIERVVKSGHDPREQAVEQPKPAADVIKGYEAT